MVAVHKWWGLAGAGVALSLTPIARAQQIPAFQSLFALNGSLANAHLGTVVGSAGDADGDGRADVLIGRDSQLFVISGATGQTLYPVPSQAAGDFARATTFPINDLDGDARAEIVVAAPFADPDGLVDAGAVYLLSGATGRILRTIRGEAPGDQFGASAALLGDENGDGAPELVVGAPGNAGDLGDRVNAGGVAVVSLSDGSTLHFFRNTVAGERWGTSVVALGDVSGDGRPDFAAGAPFSDTTGLVDAGLVIGISPSDPIDTRTLFLVVGLQAGDEFGTALASAGDVDADGKTDMLIGAPGRSADGGAAAGIVFVWSTAGRRVLGQIGGGAAGDRFGSVVVSGGDLNADGRADILVGTPLADVEGRVDAGRVEVYSGANGQPIARFQGDSGDQMGAAVAFLGDANGDGRAEIIAGAPFSDPAGLSDAGTAVLLSAGGTGGSGGGTGTGGPL